MQRGYTEMDNSENVLAKQGGIILPMTSLPTEQRGTQQNDEQARGNREREEPAAFGAEKVSFCMRLYP